MLRVWKTSLLKMSACNAMRSYSHSNVDQYSDVAKVFNNVIGDRDSRTNIYKNVLLDLLRSKGCRRILDVACGTGYNPCTFLSVKLAKSHFVTSHFGFLLVIELIR